jgi:hypothetical protein
MTSEDSEKKVKFSVMVSPNLLARIDAAAEKAMKHRSEYVRELLAGTFPAPKTAEEARRSELATFGNILTDKQCDCGLRMYEDNRTANPPVKPNRYPGYWCKICDSGLLDM